MKIYLICVLAALFLTSCSSTVSTSISGYVKDSSGRPIEGAIVELAPGSIVTNPKLETNQTKSGVNGAYSVILRHSSSEKVMLSVSKEGYSRRHTQVFTHDDAPKGSNDVVLD